MNASPACRGVKITFAALAMTLTLVALSGCTEKAAVDPLPSWNEGTAKTAIVRLPEVNFIDDREGKPVGI